MKRWMLQALRLVITLVLMVAMACMIYSLREQLAVAAQDKRVAQKQIEAQQIQIDLLTKKVQETAKTDDPSEGVYVICRFDLKPETDLADYTAKTVAVVPTVRAETGCRFYSLLKDADTDWDAPQKNERVYWMLEKWDSIDALKAHLQTPHMKAFGPTVRDMRSASTFHVLQEAK